MSQEDIVVNQMISHFDSDPPIRHQFQPEVGYNDYGDKGVVDLVIESFIYKDEIYRKPVYQWLKERPRINRHTDSIEELMIVEVKSEYAISEATGANEILRQFRKHQDHFFKGSDYKKSGWNSTQFVLAIAQTPKTKKHVANNWRMYENTDGTVQMWDMESASPGPTIGNNNKPKWAHTCKQYSDGGICGSQAVWLKSGSKPICEKHAVEYDKDELDEIT